MELSGALCDFGALSDLLSRAQAEEEDRVARGAGAKSRTVVVAGGAGGAGASGAAPSASAVLAAGAAKQRAARQPARASNNQDDGAAIWDASELETPHVAAFKAGDGRRRPEYDIVYKQSVGSETVYFGMDDQDPGSHCCQELVVKIQLPGEQFKDLDLDVQRQSLVVSSPGFHLATYLPVPVDAKQGSAKWLAEKAVLAVTLPIIED
jgi:hypothetical protein